jgi:hypothetical protein
VLDATRLSTVLLPRAISHSLIRERCGIGGAGDASEWTPA